MEENAELEQFNESILALHARIMKLMNWTEEKSWQWVGTENPLLGYVSPVEMILLGKLSKVIEFVDYAESELIIEKDQK